MVHLLSSLHIFASLLRPLADDPNNPLSKLGITTFLDDIKGYLIGIGTTVFIIGIIIGGIMRMTAFGSERRIAASNVALSCAVVGFVIVLLSTTLSTVLSGAFK